MQHGADRLVVPKRPKIGKITEDEVVELFDEGVGDVCAPVHYYGLWNMEFASDDEDEDYNPSVNCDDY